jgi:hypothetical protein
MCVAAEALLPAAMKKKRIAENLKIIRAGYSKFRSFGRCR